MLEQKAAEFREHEILTSKGVVVPFDKLFLTTGPLPNTEFLEKGHSDWLDEQKQVKVQFLLDFYVY